MDRERIKEIVAQMNEETELTYMYEITVKRMRKLKIRLEELVSEIEKK